MKIQEIVLGKINILNMKNYNKILEAINRGIQLALDDFDDEEQVQHVKSKQVYNRDYTKEYLDLMKEVVDLGLPSGTLWCKYNLGVNQNQLAKAEDWYGNYYAWGELQGNKPIYKLDNYKFGNDYRELTKYCNNPKYGLNSFTDNLTELLPEDDVAYQNKKLYNFKFHIPTKEQCEELLKYTKNYWINNYDPSKTEHNSDDDEGIQGLNGRVFEGKNGNQLFIPAAGCRYGSYINNAGSYCRLWSSSLLLSSPYSAYYLYFSSGIIYMSNHGDRFIGYSVCPVLY